MYWVPNQVKLLRIANVLLILYSANPCKNPQDSYYLYWCIAHLGLNFLDSYLGTVLIQAKFLWIATVLMYIGTVQVQYSATLLYW
jgi:hypothetical protein